MFFLVFRWEKRVQRPGTMSGKSVDDIEPRERIIEPPFPKSLNQEDLDFFKVQKFVAYRVLKTRGDAEWCSILTGIPASKVWEIAEGMDGFA